jgi:hypothetical protein
MSVLSALITIRLAADLAASISVAQVKIDVQGIAPTLTVSRVERMPGCSTSSWA